MDKPSLIKKIKTLEGLTNDEKSDLINLLNQTKKYGLVWEDKSEDVERELLTKLPVLIEVKERRILANNLLQPQHDVNQNYEPPVTTLFDNPEPATDQEVRTSDIEINSAAPNHILIEGDNLHALTALTFTHESCVDVIYIDPPYNTGSKEDFIFNDHYVDKEDTFRHSKWISFMEKRLKIAKRLLSDDGVIFCSIGDDEIAQLTMLFNEVFRDENQLGLISRVAKTAGDKGNYFAPSKDYILVYSKNKSNLPDFKDEVDESLFKKTETDGPKKGEKYRDDVAFYQSSLDTRPNQRYFIKCPDGSFVIPPGISFPDVIADGAKAIPIDGDGVWRWANETFFDKDKRALLIFKQTKKSPLLDQTGKNANWNIYTKSYLSDRSEKGKSPRDYLDQFINRKAADFIKLYDIEFSYSKPLELISHLIKITNKPKNITILDFFAGSGTTLHSTISLNKIDKGTRTCIIVTNNENNICDDVTYPRCTRILTPYINSRGTLMPFFPNNNLRYFKTGFIPSAKTEANRRLLTSASTGLLQIKEDCYIDITVTNGFDPSKCVIYTNNSGKYLIIVYYSRKQHEVVPNICLFIQNIPDLTEKVRVYAFSAEAEVLVNDFHQVAEKINAVPLPDAIYNAYRATFKTLKLEKKQFIAPINEYKVNGTEVSENSEAENQFELFEQDGESNL